LLQRAQLLVLPSLSETFGLVILEAWAAGAPVLCSRTSGASALVRHGINGWLFYLDEPEARGFHECLGHALRETETTRVMAAEGASMVARQYSIAAQATQLSGLYEELVEARKCTT
jgi:glycosyltransferase involved in cell wall biosynthesis